MDRPVSLGCSESLSMIRNRVELPDTVGDVVLTEDAGDCLVASVCFNDSFKSTVKLYEDRSREEALPKFVEGGLLSFSPKEGNVLSQFRQRPGL